MELKALINPLLKYWWLLVAACIVASTSSFLVTRRQPPVYQTRTTLLVGRAVLQPNPVNNELGLNETLASYYADLAQRRPLRDATLQSLGLEWLPSYVARAVPNSQLVELVVTDTSPRRAQAVADELARQLILHSPQMQEQEHHEFVDQQLYDLEAQITETQSKITKLETELGELNSARQIAETQQEIGTLRSLLTTLQTNYAAMFANSERGAANTLTIIEPAVLPSSPIGPDVTSVVLLCTLVALVIASGAAYLLEYLDDTLKTPEEITRVSKLPVLGYVGEMGKGQNEVAYVSLKPRSLIAESFRSLRVNLDFVAVDEPLRTILVTSSGVGEGKTSISTNLAIVMAQGGKNVVLLDGDLRRPSVHRFMGLLNKQGISDVFRGSLKLDDVINSSPEENLSVVTAGIPPPNPTDLLGSKKMDTILESLKKQADVIIIDGPPFLVPDASVLSTKVDGVLMVIRHASTRKGAVQASLEQLNRAGARVVGIALNRLPHNKVGYYYGNYHYYSPYVTGDEGEQSVVVEKNGKFHFPEFLRRQWKRHPRTDQAD